MPEESVSEATARMMETIERGKARAAEQEQSRSSASPVDWTAGEPRAWIISRLSMAGVPQQYRTAERAKCRVQEELDRWEKNAVALLRAGRGVVVFGPVGTGKSSTAALVAAEALKVGATVGWRYVPDLCDLMMDKYRRVEERRAATAPDMLVLDDFGARPFSDFEVGLLDQVIENRYRRGRSTVVTTNIPQSKIGDDDRLARMLDRLRERCDGWVLGGTSMRSTA